jgi:hypothetical protein
MNVRQLIEQRFGAVREQTGKRGKEYRVCCPECVRRYIKHTPDRGFKLYINPTVGAWNCYRCGYKGQNMDFLLGRAIVENPFAPPPPPTVEEEMKEREPRDTLVPLEYMSADHPAISYLRRRGFDTLALGRLLRVQYVSRGYRYMPNEDSDLFFDTNNTLMFPVWVDKKLVGWQYRLLYEPGDLTDAECLAMGFPRSLRDGRVLRPAKYHTSPGLRKSQVLYNLDQACAYDLGVLVEGVLDVGGVGPCGVAGFGKKYSEHQIGLAKRHWKVLVSLLDSDAGSETQAMVFALGAVKPVAQVSLPGGKDPGSTKTRVIWTEIFKSLTAAGIDPRSLKLPRFTDGVPRP